MVLSVVIFLLWEFVLLINGMELFLNCFFFLLGEDYVFRVFIGVKVFLRILGIYVFLGFVFLGGVGL